MFSIEPYRREPVCFDFLETLGISQHAESSEWFSWTLFDKSLNLHCHCNQSRRPMQLVGKHCAHYNGGESGLYLSRIQGLWQRDTCTVAVVEREYYLTSLYLLLHFGFKSVIRFAFIAETTHQLWQTYIKRLWSRNRIKSSWRFIDRGPRRLSTVEARSRLLLADVWTQENEKDKSMKSDTVVQRLVSTTTSWVKAVALDGRCRFVSKPPEHRTPASDGYVVLCVTSLWLD